MMLRKWQQRKVLTSGALLGPLSAGLIPLRVASTIALTACLTACGGSDSAAPVNGPQHGPAPSGYVYVSASGTSGGAGSVLQYSIGTDGSLTPLSSPSVATGKDPTAITSDPTGRYVYAVNSADHTISQYSIGARGELTPLSPATVSIPLQSTAGSFRVSIDPSGHYLYVVASSQIPVSQLPSSELPVSLSVQSTIAQYSIDGGGLLTPLTPAVVTLSLFAAGPLVIDSIGHHAYLAGYLSGVVLQFSVGTDGTLSPLPLGGVSAFNATDVVLTPRDDAAYVLGSCVDVACDGQVSLYLMQPDGSLNPRVSSTLTGSHIVPVDLTLAGSGSSAYLLTNLMGVDTNSGKLYPFTIDNSGALVPQGEIDTGSAAVAQALNGSNLYVLTSDARATLPNGSGGHLAHFTVGGGGMPSVSGSIPITGQNPTAMTLVITP
jgi:6-phosphogluconolactonase (cycloisomerase 2 family)